MTAKHGYLFHLHHWGEIMNNDQKWLEKEFGIKEQDHWFDSNEERALFKEKLQKCADNHKCMIVFSEHDGNYVKFRTIAKMKMHLNDGRIFDYKYDFGFGYPKDSAEFMFHEGNYSCDCNRSLLLNQEGHDVEEMECGESIKISDFLVTHECLPASDLPA